MNESDAFAFLRSMTAIQQEVIAQYYAVDLILRCYPDSHKDWPLGSIKLGSIDINLELYPECMAFIEFLHNNHTRSEEAVLAAIVLPIILYPERIKHNLLMLWRSGSVGFEYDMAIGIVIMQNEKDNREKYLKFLQQ